MADLDDLNISSILDMSQDEALEHIRQVRLARRTPIKVSKPKTSKSKQQAVPKLSADMAAELLKSLEENS